VQQVQRVQQGPWSGGLVPRSGAAVRRSGTDVRTPGAAVPKPCVRPCTSTPGTHAPPAPPHLAAAPSAPPAPRVFEGHVSALDILGVVSGDFSVGEWRVQPAVNRLQRGDEVVRLEPKVMQVLVCLAEQAGEVVTREELIARVWPDVFVTDDVLHRAIRELRRGFGDSSSAPRYIETIRKRGYRLIADADRTGDLRPSPEPPSLPGTSVPAGNLRPSPEPPSLQATSVPPSDLHPHAKWQFLLLAAGVALACAAAVFALVGRPPTIATEAHARFVPIVSGPLNESDPAISPDGARVAFVQREAGVDASADVYVRNLRDGHTIRLTIDAASDRMPAWAPDGQRLAFIRMTASACDVYVRGLDGHAETRVAACGNHEDPRVAWTADGRALLTSQTTSRRPLSGWRIVRLSLDTAATTSITDPPAGVVGDHSPAVSPDGRRVAFIRRASGGVSDVFVAPINGGTVRRVTFDDADLTGVDWSGDGTSLVYSSDRAGGYSLWRVAAEGGTPRLIAGGAARMKHPVTDRSGRRVVYENWAYEINIWQVGLVGQVGRVGRVGQAVQVGQVGQVAQAGVDARAVIKTSDLWNLYPQISPDGAHLVYVSTQSGNHELWIADRDGRNARQLTRLDRGTVLSPRWSPDGRRVVYLARGETAIDVQVIDVTTGAATAITSTAATEVAPSWSHDARQVFYGAISDDGSWNVWSVDAGGGAPQILIANAVAAQPSVDGAALYFTRPDRAGLWRVPTSQTATEELVLDTIAAGNTASWAVTTRGIYFVDEVNDVVHLRHKASVSAAATDVATLTQLSWPGFSVSPDGAHVVYARWDRRESNIMSIEF
jgi:Tol biopolymer transport system component/DNA-binding winged helix-turn-helix (wHTH) protein